MKNSKVLKASFNPAIRDAFYKAENGNKVVAQAKRELHRQKVINRKKQLEQLVYMTFCDPQYVAKHNIRWDVYEKAEQVVWEIAKKSDEEIQKFAMVIKHAYTSPEAYQDAVQLLTSSVA